MTYEERYNNFDLNDFLANDPEMHEFLEKEYEKEKENHLKRQEEYESWKKEKDEENEKALREALDNEHGADDVVEFLASRFPDGINK